MADAATEWPNDVDIVARGVRVLSPAEKLDVIQQRALTRIVRKTPAGRSLRRITSSMARAQPGTFEACLSTAVLPAMSAGAAKRKTCQKGKFQGMIARTTPSGANST